MRDTFILPLIFFLLLAGPAAAGTMRVHFIDVGYGDSIFVELPGGESLLIDAGDRKSGAGEYLERLGVTAVGTAVITHPHANHFGGFEDMAGRLSFRRFFINGETAAGDAGYPELLETLRRSGTPVTAVKRGDVITGLPEEVTLHVLNPAATSGQLNAEALVLLLSYREISFLLTADIAPQQQEEVLALIPDPQKIACVQLPHHGGEVSPEFAAAFAGRVFIVSTGDNPYGLPNESAIERLDGEILRTDRDGTIILETDGENLDVKNEQLLATGVRLAGPHLLHAVYRQADLQFP